MSIGNATQLFKNTNALHRKNGIVKGLDGRSYLSYRIGPFTHGGLAPTYAFLVKEVTDSTLDWLKTKHWDLRKFFLRNSYVTLYYLTDYTDKFEMEMVTPESVEDLLPPSGMYYEA